MNFLRRRRKLIQLAVVAVPLFFSMRARADGIIYDPYMGVERGDESSPFVVGASLTADQNGGGLIGFYNPTDMNITEMQFTAYIDTGLSYSVNTPYDNVVVGGTQIQCQDSYGGVFFENCSINYNPAQGALWISFWGTVAPATYPPTTDEAYDQLGIPPLLSGCASTPDAAGCNDIGHFLVTLNNDYSVNNDLGGWNNTSLTGGNGAPNFTVSQYSTIFGATPSDPVPEPGQFLMVGSALIGLGCLAKRHLRRS